MASRPGKWKAQAKHVPAPAQAVALPARQYKPEDDQGFVFSSFDDDLDDVDNVVESEVVEENEDGEEEGEDDEEEDEWETEEDEDEDEEYDDSKEDIEAKNLAPKKSLPDVEGAIPKSILRKLPNSTIRKIVIHVKKHILMLETENYLYEKTIEKLEAAEKEIESRIPFSAEEFEEHLKKTRELICSSDSEPDPEDTGEYEPIVPTETIRVSQDSFFENMSDNSKGTALTFFKVIGDLAPSHYDVMRHKYGDYVGTAKEKVDFAGEPGMRTRLNTGIFTSRVQLDDKMNSAAASVMKPAGAKSLDELEAKRSVSSQSVDNEDFSGFNLADAKKLSITDRLRFALEEEEEFRKRFYHHETQALKDESSIQVHIDSHKHALAILMGIRKDFRMIAKGATGVGMNGKTMSDLLVKFRRKMKNQLSAEETKARITIRKVVAQKKRTLEQLKINKEAGRHISHIDFEYLLCESSILEAEINGMNTTLQHLKDLTAQFHLVLQDERQMLEKMMVEEKKMNQELRRRHDLLYHFHDAYVKYRQQIAEANVRMESIKRKLHELNAPQPMDYIRLKAQQYELESEVHSLERKLKEVNLNLHTIRGNYNQYIKHLPGGRTTDQENQIWLDEIKKEMEERDLLHEMDEDEEESDEDTFTEPSPPIVELEERKKSRLTMEVAAGRPSRMTMSDSQTQGKRSTVRLPNIPTLLMAPRRFDELKANERRSKVPIYDLDYNDLDEHLLDEDDLETGKVDAVDEINLEAV